MSTRNHGFDEQVACAIEQHASIDQWINMERLASRVAEVLQPLSSAERQHVLAEVEILLRHQGSS